MEDVDVAVRNLEIKSLSHFSVYQKDKSFGVADINLKNHKILFEDIKNKESPQQILWSGTPFLIVGKKSLDCTHGVDHGILKKKKIQDEKIKGKDSQTHRKVYSTARFMVQNSKKLGCPAKIIIRDIAFFPDFKVSAFIFPLLVLPF
ncbi:uncharacterized protein LOC130614741 [Hydractinia symbiolongicarpus]|uniref:uncharacterized protein LOC130614741 n=1 Tax=Hydractinia symbiolongicarpus TaxID=13093 RepID=UPI00254A79E6|nr:uncharacterized protein LOC130614741 [Hydractinia symbiolongicarpus]